MKQEKSFGYTSTLTCQYLYGILVIVFEYTLVFVCPCDILIKKPVKTSLDTFTFTYFINCISLVDQRAHPDNHFKLNCCHLNKSHVM